MPGGSLHQKMGLAWAIKEDLRYGGWWTLRKGWAEKPHGSAVVLLGYELLVLATWPSSPSPA